MSARGAKKSRGQYKKINQIFDRHYEGSEHCGFCPERRAVYELTPKQAEGLPSRYLCRECFGLWQELEIALDMMYKGVRQGKPGLISLGVNKINERKGHASFDQLSRAIDIVRESSEKERLFKYKDALTKIFLNRFGDRLNVVIRHDRKYNNARITWFGIRRWSCHLPEDQLGRFRELALTTK